MIRRRSTSPLDASLHVKMTKDMYDDLNRIADAQEVTLGAIVRDVLEQFIEQYKQEHEREETP